MIVNGIKPVFVFDGKPPPEKARELEKRTEKREVTSETLLKKILVWKGLKSPTSHLSLA